MINKILRSNTLGNVVEFSVSDKTPVDDPIDFAESVFVKEQETNSGTETIHRQYFVIRGSLLYWYENLESEKQKRIVLLKNVSINEEKQELNIFYKDNWHHAFFRNQESFLKWKMIVHEKGNNVIDERFHNHDKNMMETAHDIQCALEEIRKQNNGIETHLTQSNEEKEKILLTQRITNEKMKAMENHLFVLLQKMEDMRRRQIEWERKMDDNWIRCKICIVS